MLSVYFFLGCPMVGCHAGMWVQCGSVHRLVYIFDAAEPELDEWAEATNEATRVADECEW